MPKRGAEKQLSKDNMDQEEDDEIQETSGEGFRKADETVLAGRKIRGLPKRGGSSSSSMNSVSTQSTVANEASEPSTPKFGGFSGFGVSNGSSTPFSFTAPATVASSSSAPTPFGAPVVSSKASNATKSFASLLGQSTSMPSASDASKVPSAETPKDDEAEYKYYLALRGINVSLISALSKAVDSDPFADISNMLESYKSLRIKAQTDYDSQNKTSSSVPSSSSAATAPAATPSQPSSSLFAASSSIAPAAVPSLSMPKPPAAFAGFSAPSNTAFPPPDSSKPSSDSFPSFAPPKPSTEPSAPLASTSPVLPAPKPSSPFAGFSGFGAPSASSSSFGGASTSLFGTSKPDGPKLEEKKSEDVPTSGGSGFSMFGSGSSTKPAAAAPTPSFFSTPPVGSSAAGSNPFTFGAAPSSNTGFGTSSGFTFGDSGSTTPKKPDMFAGFGTTKTSPSGSLGNPVGFGFGSASAGASKPTGLTTGSSGFSFGSTSSSSFGSQNSAKENQAEDETTEGGDSQSQPEGDAATQVGGPNHDEEGEGEEDEVTTHAVKSKCHIFGEKKSEDGKTVNAWIELGVGILRLKKQKESEARRILMRNSSSGRIILNFSLFEGFSTKLQPKGVLTFIGHDNEGNAKSYRVRVATETKAKELQEAIDQEVNALGAKDS